MRPTDRLGTFSSTSGGPARDGTEDEADAVGTETGEGAVEGAMGEEVSEAVEEAAGAGGTAAELEEDWDRPCGTKVKRRKPAKRARRISGDDMTAG
jgi:hypothetical protein